MAEVTYTTTQELVFDHDRTCEFCNQTFTVVVRRIVAGQSGYHTGALATVFNLDGAAQASASESAKEAAAIVVKEAQPANHRQRCPCCGKYDTQTIQRMLDSYPQYVYRRYFTLGCGTFIISPLVALVFYATVIKPNENDKMALFWAVVTALGVLAVPYLIAYLRTRPISKMRFTNGIQKANDPEVIAAWLKNWNERSPKHVEELKKSEQRFGYDWLALVKIKHFMDPIHGLDPIGWLDEQTSTEITL